MNRTSSDSDNYFTLNKLNSLADNAISKIAFLNLTVL